MKHAVTIFAVLLTVAITSTTASAQLRGDVDLNNYVSAPDLNIILTNWHMGLNPPPSWTDGDIDPYNSPDDFVGASDYNEVLTYWASGTFVPLTPVAQSTPAFQWVEVLDPDVPAGYRCWDGMIQTSTDLSVVELVLHTDLPGDIYQHAFGAETEPDPAAYAIPGLEALEFDTYVTMGAWPYQAHVQVILGAVDLHAGATKIFDNRDLNISWAWSPITAPSGPGTYQVARVTLADTASGAWEMAAWETGNQNPSYFVAPFLNGALPEPATLGLLLLGGLALLSRRK